MQNKSFTWFYWLDEFNATALRLRCKELFSSRTFKFQLMTITKQYLFALNRNFLFKSKQLSQLTENIDNQVGTRKIAPLPPTLTLIDTLTLTQGRICLGGRGGRGQFSDH